MDMYISQHCDGDKSDLNLAIAQVVATVPGCDADALTNELKRVVCNELYTREHEKYRSCDFVDTAWPIVRTKCDEFANNQPSAATMTARRLSVTAVYNAAGFQGSVYPYTWVAEQGRIVQSLRDKYTNETTFQSHWINFLQFVKIVAPDMVQSYAQAFKATQNDANRKERYVMPVETLNRIRKSNTLLVDQATVILNSQTEDKLLTSKQLKPVMAALVVEAFYGAQPMRRGDWRTVKLSSADDIDVSKDNFLSVDEGKVTLTMTYAAKVGQLAKQVSVDFSLESPRFNELLLLCCQTIHPYTGYLFITPTGLQYCPTNFSNLLKQTLLQKLQIELPSYGVTMTRHAVVNEEREENAKKRRTRGLVQTEMNHAKQRLHSSSTANQVYGVR